MPGFSSFGRPQPEEPPAPPEHTPHLGKATMDLVFVPQMDEPALERMADHLASVVRAAVAAGMAVGMSDAVRDADEATLEAEPNDCGCLERPGPAA
jgi:hypothetical protein